MGADCAYTRRGFTLIELSVVLVVIGLIVGGILVGQSLISAASLRAQITQIEKYNSAANTFFEKYGYLPGDIPAVPAAQFGFAARGQYAGEGDGNGFLEGIQSNSVNDDCGPCIITGENAMFWVDLSAAHLIEGGFRSATSTSVANSALPISAYLPQAQLGNGNSIYVFSGTCGTSSCSVFPPSFFKGAGNYFGLGANASLQSDGYHVISALGLTVQQAYSIDQKVDDGLPQSGRLLALYINTVGGSYQLIWAGTGTQKNPYTTATAGSSTSCFDNGNTAGATQQYSVEISNGAGVICALSFKMQAGD
jgi:prepilin-type N-terminal cleavage/methylation domain-containing protein